MAVAFDAITNSTLTSFTHTPVGTPRGVLVLFSDDTTISDRVSNVTYGGVACSEVALSPITHNGAADDHVLHGYFLGSSIPTGAQTVAYTASAGTQRIGCITLTADADTEVKDTTTLEEVGVTGDRTGTLSLGGATSFCAEVIGCGAGAVTGVNPLTGWTARRESDEGTNTTYLYTYDTVASTDVTFGANMTVTDDIVMLAVAVGEVAAGGVVAPKLALLGVGA